MGEVTEAFESEFARQLGSKHAVAVASGTAALHLALVALNLGPGDEVICPSLSFVATANAVLYTGARPVFADIASTADPTISPQAIEALITPRTKAILVMHYAGYPCQMDEIRALAETHSIPVVEDAAHVPLAEYQGAKAGTLGALGCFSFFSNKNLTTAEGGMIVTDDDELAARLRRLRSHGMTTLSYDRYRGNASPYDVSELGFNYRMDDIRAALGIAQLEQLRDHNRRRKEIADAYREVFRELPGMTLPFLDFERGRGSEHIFPVVLPAPDERAGFVDSLRQHGVQTSVHYPPIHQFRMYREIYPGLRLPITEGMGSCEVTLPLFPTMTQEQISWVMKVVQSAWMERVCV
jgi:dTDP-4-amino-4,6-dideoxygalactose transaminase